jgi:hypothetical protein
VLIVVQDNAEVRPRHFFQFLDSTKIRQALANKLWLKTADLVALEGKDCKYSALVHIPLLTWSLQITKRCM